MKKTTKIRLLAFILTLCMTIGTLPLYVFADGTEAELPEQITEATNENLTAFQLGLGEKSVAELENMTLSAADIPASISREAVEAKDHVLRLREQEADLNTVIFQNRDGGKTVYLFGSPVKYVDANGNIRDKSTTLVSENVTVNGKTYAHSATDNFFGQYYPTMPQNGVMLAFGPYTIEMTPVITGVLTLRDTTVSDNKVTYNKVFGTGTSLVYTPTLNGVKEDIILSAYTGKSSFSFTLKTNGLAIIQDENDTFLADFEGNKVASLGDVIITDKVGKTTYGTMTVVTKTEREEYTVTVNAPTAFLTSPTTVYPVVVDPTLSIYDHNTFMDDYGNSVEIIHDMCIYQNGSATSPISTIGSLYYDEDSCEMETARMLYRLNPYYFSSSDSPLLYMTSPRFESASLFTTVSLGQESSVTVDIYPYNAIWSYEENVYGDQIYSNGTTADYTSNPDYNNLVGSVCASTTVYYTEPMETEFDITPIVNYWIASSSDSANDDHPTYEYGFMMRLPEEEGSIEKLSVWQSEYSGTSVYIAIDYNNLSGSYYVNSCDTGKFLSFASTSSVAQSVYGSEDYQGWTFTYKGNNLYEIALTANPNRLLYMDSSYNVAIGSRSSLNSANYTWQLSFYYNYVTIRNQGTGKYLYAPESGTSLGGTSSVSLAHWRMCKTSNYKNLTSFDVGDVACKNGEFTNYIISKGNNATWSSYDDFILSSTVPFSLNNARNKISYSVKGTHSITIIHKPTGITDTFDLVVYRPAVFLIHGRTDNSYTLWGVNSRIYVNPYDTSKKNNNHYDNNINAKSITEYGSALYTYTSVQAQEIHSYQYDSDTVVSGIFNGQDGTASNVSHPEGGNLAYYFKWALGDNYQANVDLYVFNYPNVDAVVHSANKLDAYLTNLANEIRGNGTKQQKASLFGKIDGLTFATPLNIHIVGHSMGGLVARYYIENIGKDENVEKLVTIDTPHWGSSLANLSNSPGWFNKHELCDHDLTPNSAMYGGNLSTSLECSALIDRCDVSEYVLTDELDYDCNRRTKYYAIAGIDYNSYGTSEKDLRFELSSTISSYDELYDEIHAKTENKLFKRNYVDSNGDGYIDIYYDVPFTPSDYGDNVVEFMSQIGWKDNEGVTKIHFEKIFVNIDATGSYNVDNHFHSAMPHRIVVIQKIYTYLME